ncbi:MAG: hypothetical protein ACRDVK_01715 [Acidimicrobiia bacterium]
MNRTARILAVVLTVVLVGVGLYAAYQSGYDNAALTAATAAGADDTGSRVVVDRGWGHRGYGFGFFPFFWIFPLLFFFLIFSAFRRRGPWGPGGADWGPRHEYVEGRFRQMHDRAHKDEGQAPPA